MDANNKCVYGMLWKIKPDMLRIHIISENI
jgi:hypothetical protein